MHDFGSLPSDGTFPSQSLVFDGAGNLYGTTLSGGANGGSVYKLSPVGNSWTYSQAYAFSGTSGLQGPNGVIFDANGNMYAAGQGGYFEGTETCGAVSELLPAGSGWTQKVLYGSFSCYSGLNFPMGGLVFDRSGNLYGTASNNGTELGGGGVYELVYSEGTWSFVDLYTFPSNGGAPFDTLTMDSTGDIYGTTSDGGINGMGSIFKFTPDGHGGWTLTDLYDFVGGTDGAFPQAAILIDSEGNLYGAAAAGGINEGNCPDGGCGTVWELTP